MLYDVNRAERTNHTPILAVAGNLLEWLPIQYLLWFTHHALVFVITVNVYHTTTGCWQ